MWFKFPEGVDNISVQQQNFRSEAQDKEGGDYFRAPDHFAPIILELPGFSRVMTPPEGAPADLPKEDSETSLALGSLASQVDALKQDNQNLREENANLIRERDALVIQVATLEVEVKESETKEKEPMTGAIVGTLTMGSESEAGKPGGPAAGTPGKK